MTASWPRACRPRARAKYGCRSPSEPNVVRTIRRGVLPEPESGREKSTIRSSGKRLASQVLAVGSLACRGLRQELLGLAAQQQHFQVVAQGWYGQAAGGAARVGLADLLDPLHRLVQPPAGLGLLSLTLVGHCQEQP